MLRMLRWTLARLGFWNHWMRLEALEPLGFLEVLEAILDPRRRFWDQQPSKIISKIDKQHLQTSKTFTSIPIGRLIGNWKIVFVVVTLTVPVLNLAFRIRISNLTP